MRMTLLTFAELMEAANASKHPRLSGQWTPLACQIWREADPEDARRLEAAIAWELASGRRAMSIDEAEVRERRAAMDEATAATKANTPG
jgi:hypothetical protein